MYYTRWLGKNDKPMISETLSLRVTNMVNEWKYPINICTSNTDDNYVDYCYTKPFSSPLVNLDLCVVDFFRNNSKENF